MSGCVLMVSVASVRYTEQYEHIPLLTNTALANYSVYQDEVLSTTQQYPVVVLRTTQASQDLRISSVHVTCLLPGELWCLTSTGENSFRFHDTGTEVAEVGALG